MEASRSGAAARRGRSRQPACRPDCATGVHRPPIDRRDGEVFRVTAGSVTFSGKWRGSAALRGSLLPRPRAGRPVPRPRPEPAGSGRGRDTAERHGRRRSAPGSLPHREPERDGQRARVSAFQHVVRPGHTSVKQLSGGLPDGRPCRSRQDGLTAVRDVLVVEDGHVSAMPGRDEDQAVRRRHGPSLAVVETAMGDGARRSKNPALLPWARSRAWPEAPARGPSTLLLGLAVGALRGGLCPLPAQMVTMWPARRGVGLVSPPAAIPSSFPATGLTA